MCAMRWGQLKDMQIADDEPVVLPRIEKMKRERNKQANIHEPYHFWKIMVTLSQLLAIEELWPLWVKEVGQQKAVDRLIAAMSDYTEAHLRR